MTPERKAELRKWAESIRKPKGSDLVIELLIDDNVRVTEQRDVLDRLVRRADSFKHHPPMPDDERRELERVLEGGK